MQPCVGLPVPSHTDWGLYYHLHSRVLIHISLNLSLSRVYWKIWGSLDLIDRFVIPAICVVLHSAL